MKKLFILIGVLLLVGRLQAKQSADPVLEDLKKQVAEIQATRLAHDTKIAAALADLQKIQGEFQGIRGNHDALAQQILSLQQLLHRHYQDLSQRLQVIEDEMKLYETQMLKALAKVSPPLAEESKQFQKGLEEYKNSEYLPAIATFHQFLKKYPKSPLQAEGYYWIGESQFALKKYEEAIKTYQQLVAKFPQSEKTPGSLLQQGNAFAELKFNDEAKVFWQKLIKDFPNSTEAQTAKAKLDAVVAPSATPGLTTSPAPPPAQPTPEF